MTEHLAAVHPTVKVVFRDRLVLRHLDQRGLKRKHPIPHIEGSFLLNDFNRIGHQVTSRPDARMLTDVAALAMVEMNPLGARI